MNKVTNYLLVLCIGINVLSLNYIVGGILSLSGQQVSLATNLCCLAVILRRYGELLKVRFLGVILLVVFVVPLAGYSINYYGQDFDRLVFWANRSVLILLTYSSTAIILRRVSPQFLSSLSNVFLLIYSSSVIISYFFPLEALYVFTNGGEEIWGNIDNLSTTRAFGLDLSPTVAAAGMINLYVAAQIFSTASGSRIGVLYGALLDALVIGVLVLTGSRSYFVIGTTCVILINLHRGSLDIVRRESSLGKYVSLRRLVYLGGFLIVGATLISDSVGSQRILGEITGVDSGGGNVSTEIRLIAWNVGLALFGQNIFFGVGFDALQLKGIILSHNMFLHYLITNGLILGSVYLYFLYSVGRSIYRVEYIWLSTSVILSLVGSSLFSHSVLDDKTFPWLIISAAYLVGERMRSRRQNRR